MKSTTLWKSSMVLGLAFGLILAATSAGVHADIVVFVDGENSYTGARDNFIWDGNVNNTNGGGTQIFSGRNATGELRRALIAFDVSSIPSNATINSVSLQLTVSNAPLSGAAAPTAQSLYRLTRDWGEGTVQATGSESSGAPAQAGDATWAYSAYNTIMWTGGGATGDYITTASATATVAGILDQPVWMGPILTQDLQDWVDGSASNFGWILIGDELTNFTARRYSSSDNSLVPTSQRPRLTVDYTVVTPVDNWEIY